ncbi:MAG: cellulase family glycosylhydrolase [Bacteroidia bacterium]|nr:cellulase family glycosylhydrolase [Bacteroidia bacterium]
MSISGKNVLDANNNIITLRGMNFPIMDVGTVDLNTPATYTYLIDEFVKTGSNVIRIPWNTNGVHWRDQPAHGGTPGTMDGYITNGKLGQFIDYCFSKNLFVILEIHDATCQNDWTILNNVIVPFWTSSNVVNLINSHKSKLIINIANEFGYDSDWGGNNATFKTNYNNAITTLRNAGITVPLMIDAPNCGMASSSLVSMSSDILNADPLKNIIFSAHTYWSAYANMNVTIDNKMNEMINNSQCFVLGEIANLQDNNACGDTDISSIYIRVLTDACPAKMGWLSWSYFADCAPNRQATTDGYFANLTAFGDDLVNNSLYGLKTSFCATPLQVSEIGNQNNTVLIFPNPAEDILYFSEEISDVKILDVYGRTVIKLLVKDKSVNISGLAKGAYILTAVSAQGKKINRKLIKQ